MDLFLSMDYRQYLKDRMAFEKGRNRHFSFRYFARVAGFSSPGFLKMVMDGQRNLTPSSIQQVTKAFKLTKKEAGYFEALVLFNQAVGDQERDHYFDRLKASRPPVQLQGLQKDQYEYFTHKHFVIIREMVALPNFKEDPAWIGASLRPTVKTKDVEHAIEVLLRLGLVKRDESGKLVQSDASVTTPAEVESREIYEFHQSMLNEAKQAMLTVPSDLRDMTSLTIPIPKDRLPEIKSRIQAFREEIIDLINKGSVDYHEVYQMNVQLFPVSHTKEDK